MEYVFFSMNDFEKEGGGTIRMLGIINGLAEKGNDVIFISNANKVHHFNSKVKHIFINYLFSRKDKRIFQSLLLLFSVTRVNRRFNTFLKRLKEIFGKEDISNRVYFFEYLDNSIGFWLKKNGLIKEYINDIHGVASMEFFFQAEYEKSFINRINFIAKAFMSKRLDKLVFNSAEALIFASEAMRKFYIKQYPAVANKKYTILPYLLISPKPNPVDFALKQQLVEKFNIKNDEKIFLFAGAFKKIGGVPDLITAYNFISKKNKNTRLFIIGDGPSMEECKALITKLKIDNNVFLIGRIPYTFLRTYQDIAHIIVCPDKKNPFSELIVHVKYLDAWASGKIVIVGAFESVKEINPDESLSLMFQPSNIDSLSNVMQKALDEYEILLNKYRNTSNYTLENLSYSNFISNKPLIAAEI